MLDIATAPATVLFETICHSRSEATVAVTLYELRHFVVEAMDSVFRQDLEELDLIVVDDQSSDGGESVVMDWMAEHSGRFGRCLLVQHTKNSGLAAGRNLGVAAAATDYIFILDADNQLYPRCIRECVAAAKASRADAVYPILEVFGEQVGLMNTTLWKPQTLPNGNYIDAMALIARAAWRHVGGYRRMPVTGWEDYDFWLKCAESGLHVVQVPQILARYRHTKSSMLRTVTNQPQSFPILQADLRQHHPSVGL